jgi:hypothetical protein
MAATQKLNGLQVSYAKSWAGLTTDNHLYAIYQNDVQLASDIVTEVFNQMGHIGLDSFLSKYPTKIFDHDGEYKWYLKGDSRRAITIVSYSASDSARPGANKQTFELTLAEKFFVASDVISFDDIDHMVRIEDDGRVDGINHTYTVRHLRADNMYFVPTEMLRAGRKVSKLYNLVTNTLNDQYGETQFSSMFEMRNSFSTLSKKYEVPGNMEDRKMLITMTGASGKSTTVWTRYQEMEFNFQWQKEKANQLMYSTSNKDVSSGLVSQKAPNGFTINQGAGLREQISPTYKFYYNTLTLEYLLEVMTNLSINILPEDKREFLILTGERGMILFHKLVEDKVGVLVPLGDTERIKGSGQNKGFGGQYKQFLGPQGIIITVAHMPQYDDPILNRMEHPDGGGVENYRMTIFNIGTTNGEANIQKVAPKGRSELRWYNAGSTTPFGPQSGGMGSSPVDGYEMFCQTTQGIMLKNPLSACELIPSIQY